MYRKSATPYCADEPAELVAPDVDPDDEDSLLLLLSAPPLVPDPELVEPLDDSDEEPLDESVDPDPFVPVEPELDVFESDPDPDVPLESPVLESEEVPVLSDDPLLLFDELSDPVSPVVSESVPSVDEFEDCSPDLSVLESVPSLVVSLVDGADGGVGVVDCCTQSRTTVSVPLPCVTMRMMPAVAATAMSALTIDTMIAMRFGSRDLRLLRMSVNVRTERTEDARVAFV